MDIKAQKIGIWGFGIVGKSAARFLSQLGKKIEIIDSRILDSKEQDMASLYGAWQQTHCQNGIEEFLMRNDAIVVSPGIDTRSFAQHAHKFIAELDLFHAFYNKPIIAITGSVGKTTITTLLSHIMNTQNPGWWTGGNIGNGMLDALTDQAPSRGAIIEASSFQLEQCNTFAPDFAVVTNIFANHLDRHGTQENYIKAKANIIAHQKDYQHALLPLEYKEIISGQTQAFCHYFSMQLPTQQFIATLPPSSSLFFYHNGFMHHYNNGIYTTIINLDQLPQITFIINWLIICSTLYLQGRPLENIEVTIPLCQLPAHRLELVLTINGIDFYNDSKGTTVAATFAAVEKLKEKPIILLLGGMGKGVDRGNLIRDVQPYVKKIICFGKEHEELGRNCQLHGIDYHATAHLETAIKQAFAMAISGDQVVLSPAGTSFDEFKNYEERGNFFKEQVTQCAAAILQKYDLHI